MDQIFDETLPRHGTDVCAWLLSTIDRLQYEVVSKRLDCLYGSLACHGRAHEELFSLYRIAGHNTRCREGPLTALQIDKGRKVAIRSKLRN